MYLVPEDIADRQREYRPVVIRGVVKIQYLSGYGMQRDERLHVRFGAADADIPSSFRGRSDVTGMESPRIRVGQTGQRGRMNTLRTSSIIRSGIGISVIRFSSLRLICFNLGASFFSYAVSFIGLGHNTFLSTAIYMSRLGQHTQ